jgi:hypothetical protein
MKYLLIPLALVVTQAMACPGDKSKDAMASPDDKALLASKAAPTSALANSLAAAPAAKVAKATPKAEPAKADTTLAAKAEARKAAPL